MVQQIFGVQKCQREHFDFVTGTRNVPRHEVAIEFVGDFFEEAGMGKLAVLNLRVEETLQVHVTRHEEPVEAQETLADQHRRKRQKGQFGPELEVRGEQGPFEFSEGPQVAHERVEVHHRNHRSIQREVFEVSCVKNVRALGGFELGKGVRL